MKVKDLITKLYQIDPAGESEVRIYFHRRHGGTTKEAVAVRRFIIGGDVMITDERDKDT